MRRLVIILAIALSMHIQGCIEKGTTPVETPRPQRNAKIFALADSLNPDAPAVGGGKRPAKVELTPNVAPYAFELNIAMLDALVIDKSDLSGLKLALNLISSSNAKNAKLELYKINSKLHDRDALISPQDKPFLSIPLNTMTKGWNYIDIKEQYLAWDTNRKGSLRFALVLKSDSPSSKVSLTPFAFDFDPGKKLSYFSLAYSSRVNEDIFEFGPIPVPNTFVQVVDGKLTYGGKRLKLWGLCRQDSPDTFAPERIRKLGFNAVRLWGPIGQGPKGAGWYTTDDSSRRCEITEAETIDQFDKFFAECKKNKLFIMFPALHYLRAGPRFSNAIFSDDSYLRPLGGGESDWTKWKQGISEFNKKGFNIAWLRYFDTRMAEYYKKHTGNVLNHVNPYTGKAYSRDESICIYEINNENGFLQWMLVSERIKSLPEYFAKELQSRWNSWLKNKYRTEAGLVSKWGPLGNGESLDGDSVALSPLIGEASKYPKARAADIISFMTGLVIEHDKEITQIIRNSAPKGEGANVVPIIVDTQYIKNMPWLYAVAEGGDMVAFGSYPSTLSSSLTSPPSLYILDHLTVKGKATCIYEYNALRPNSFRTEWIYKVALLASWEDWDCVFFHLFNDLHGNKKKVGEDAISHEDFLISRQRTPASWDKDLGSAGDNAWCDEIDMAKHSALAVAGRIFRTMAVKPAPNPTIFSVGPSGMNSYDLIRGIPALTPATTFPNGTKIVFDLKQTEPLKIIGVKQERAPSGPVSWNGGEVVWDWQNGRVIVDTPSAKAYVGVPAPWKFKDGIAFSGATGPYVAFGMVTEDASPILGADPNSKTLVSIVSDSQNQSFGIDLSNVAEGGPFFHPVEMGKRTKSIGLPPSMLKPVPCLISFPRIFEGRFISYDYAFRNRENMGIPGSNEIAYPDGYSAYLSVLKISKWKGSADPRMIAKKVSVAKAEKSLKTRTQKSNLWCPVPQIDWNTSYMWAHQRIRDSSVPFSSISKFNDDSKSAQSITISEMRIMNDATANVSLSFKNDNLVRIDFEFVNPPPFQALVSYCKEHIGVAPRKEELANAAYATSCAEWEFKDASSGRMFFATVKEMQGVVSASFELR